MKEFKLFYMKLLILLSINFFTFIEPIKSAENIVLIKSIFTRTVTIEELEDFVYLKEKKGLLKKLIPKEDEKKIIKLMKKEYEASLELGSKLLYSKIGNIIMTRIAKVIYPFRYPNDEMAILAIKSGTIKALSENDNKITLLTFIKAYPHKSIAIDVTEAYKIINKVESMNELVQFFANSPLKQIKE
tara:strand:+ start:1217 stop:1777 length:561 start_codon:yes stop_codon:yes gene_type:complete